MTLSELREKLEARRTEHARLGSLVSAEKLYTDILNDLSELERAGEAATVSLVEAGKETGYHPGSIARLIKAKKVTNYGTKARPRVRLAELPRKSKPPRIGAGASSHSAVSSASLENMIALDAVASRLGRSSRPRSA